jgi:hypothetical protein
LAEVLPIDSNKCPLQCNSSLYSREYVEDERAEDGSKETIKKLKQMGVIAKIKEVAKSVGISAVITNSEEKIETQLNRLTREEQLPIMLISWDINASISFDEVTGFAGNPALDIVCLLLTKPETMDKEEAEDESENMATLFVTFLQALHSKQRPLLRTQEAPITNASYQLVPRHGMGKHSGVLGRFTVRDQFNVTCV